MIPLAYRFAIDESLPEAADPGASVILVSALGAVDVPPEQRHVRGENELIERLLEREREGEKKRRRSVWDDPEFRASREKRTPT